MEIEVTQTPASADLNAVSAGLRAHNTQHIGEKATAKELKFSVFAKDKGGQVLGGVRAVALWDWVNIEAIWVAREARGAGLGRQLLAKAEEFARGKGIFFSSLETASFQARAFYQKQGYEVFGELADFPKGHTMYYMKKALRATASG